MEEFGTFNICEAHGVLPATEIMIGGLLGGQPLCMHCGEVLKSQEQIDNEQSDQQG